MQDNKRTGRLLATVTEENNTVVGRPVGRSPKLTCTGIQEVLKFVKCFDAYS